MNGPEPVVEAFVDLAHTLVGDYDLAETLERILAHCVTACGAAGAGLVVQDQGRSLRDIAYSDDRIRRLERQQTSLSEGPCFDCVRTGQPVVADDLATIRTRWPRFSPVATEAGYAGVRALPLRHHGRTLGALNLFDRETGNSTDQMMRIAQALADLAVVAILQHARPHEDAGVHITRALHDRSAIERAKGMLAHEAGTTPAEAFDFLRAHAARTGQGTTALARALVTGRVGTADVLAPQQRAHEQH